MTPTPTKLAVAIVRDEPPLPEQVRRARVAGADIVELRVDCLHDIAAVEALLAGPREVPFIVTVRSREEGGQWDGDDAERVALIERLGLLMPGYVDVEYATWQRSANLRQKIGLVCQIGEKRAAGALERDKNRLILSHHDLTKTPSNLDVIRAEMAATPADVLKFAYRAADARDALRILSLLEDSDRPTIALGMGEAGIVTRVLSRKFGGFLSFAAIERGQEAAPGQPTIEEMIDLYRWREIGPDTRVFGVVGWPVTHSLSPRLHNALMREHSIDGVYLPMPVEPTYEAAAGLLEFITAHPELHVSGLSVTMPHKQHVLNWLMINDHAIRAIARRSAAVNTLVCDNVNHWSGDNTDAPAALKALESVFGSITAKRITVLGAGGVARGIVAALSLAGAHVLIANRDVGRARHLALEFGCEGTTLERIASEPCDAIVNATSVGMMPNIDETLVPASALRPGLVVFDTVYRPLETRLLREAAAAGCVTINGLEMFARQAAMQFDAWHNIHPGNLRDRLMQWLE